MFAMIRRNLVGKVSRRPRTNTTYAPRSKMKGENPQFIETVPKRGVALIVHVEDTENLGSAEARAQNLPYHDWDWAEAESEYPQEMDLNPNDAEIHATYDIPRSHGQVRTSAVRG